MIYVETKKYFSAEITLDNEIQSRLLSRFAELQFTHDVPVCGMDCKKSSFILRWVMAPKINLNVLSDGRIGRQTYMNTTQENRQW